MHATAVAETHDCARCYCDAIEGALARTLKAATFEEPRTDNPDRALRLLGYFVDTIEGFALGAIAAHLTSGMKRWFGAEGVTTMRAAMHGWPARQQPMHVISNDARNPLAGELRAQLHVRFANANRAAQSLVAAIPDRPMTSMMLSLLAKEDTIERRIGEQLALGWRVYTAAITRAPYPAMNRLWQEWAWQLDGRPVLTRNETEQAGYIMLVR